MLALRHDPHFEQNKLHTQSNGDHSEGMMATVHWPLQYVLHVEIFLHERGG